MENKSEIELLRLKVDVMMILMEMNILNDDRRIAELISKLSEIIK